MKLSYKFSILVAIIALAGAYAQAYTTSDELTSPEQLVNYNYSMITADHVQLVKAQNANREYKSGKFKKKPFWRRAWEYIDCGTDDGNLLQHSISPGQSWKDW